MNEPSFTVSIAELAMQLWESINHDEVELNPMAAFFLGAGFPLSYALEVSKDYEIRDKGDE